MSEQQKSCQERWAENKSGRIADLRRLWALYQEGDEDGDEDLGTFTEYGLSFDYVAPHTFTDQKRGYFRYQISWGGPSDEFRFLTEHPDEQSPDIEYWFLDWGDGHGEELTGDDRALMREVWEFFQEIGSTQAEWDKAED